MEQANAFYWILKSQLIAKLQWIILDTPVNVMKVLRDRIVNAILELNLLIK